MGLKKFKPTTNSLRHTAISDFQEITKKTPEKSLLRPKKRSGGRNSYGCVTSRHRGGGHKKKYRIVDFKRNRIDDPAKVIAIEYDPNRSARLALIQYASDGEKAYILAPLDVRVGSQVLSTYENEVEYKAGNCMPIKRIPLGTAIHNIELYPGKGGKIVRSAGTSAQILSKEAGIAHLRLPSSEIRKIKTECRATIGQLGNVEHESRSIGKAGRSRWMGKRPRVRGVAMNPVDHPHGGGEGKAPQGNPHPVSPWGKATKGLKTRKLRKYSDRYIAKRRTK